MVQNCWNLAGRIRLKYHRQSNSVHIQVISVDRLKNKARVVLGD